MNTMNEMVAGMAEVDTGTGASWDVSEGREGMVKIRMREMSG